jgi:hypothetical protein
MSTTHNPVLLKGDGGGLKISLNNLIKRITRVAFGFTRYRHYRIRVLLDAGKPNWDLLATITPR